MSGNPKYPIYLYLQPMSKDIWVAEYWTPGVRLEESSRSPELAVERLKKRLDEKGEDYGDIQKRNPRENSLWHWMN